MNCPNCALHEATVQVLDQRLADALNYLAGDDRQYVGYGLTPEGVEFLTRILEGTCDEEDVA
jgi:hypothetical protein